MKRRNPRHARRGVWWTGYPFVALGDTPGKRAPIRPVAFVKGGGQKWCFVQLPDGRMVEVKRGYLFRTRRACIRFERAS